MHRGSLALFLAAVFLVGAAPVVMLGVWAARRRREQGRSQRPRSATALRVATALVVAGALGAAAYVAASPGEGAAHDEHGVAEMDPAIRLPQRLAGLRMTDAVTGEAAIQDVSALHGTSFPIRAAAVATYDGGTLRVWASTTTDERSATSMAERMAAGIAEGGSPFSSPRRLAGAAAWETRGMGQVHYFFARRDVVWWLSADPASARRAFEQIVEVAER